MSESKKHAVKCDGFEIDEAGNLKIVPMKLSIESEKQKEARRRKHVEISRLDVSAFIKEFQSENCRAKDSRGTIRKKLFKVPSNPTNSVRGPPLKKMRFSKVKEQTPITATNKNTKKLTSILQKRTPLIDLENAEALLKGRTIMKSSEKKTITFQDALNTSDTTNSDSEFLTYEKEMAMSDFEGTKMEIVLEIIKEDENHLKELKQLMTNYEIKHRERNAKIIELFTGFQSNFDYKENVKKIKRSSTSLNLRKPVLNKNLTQTPKTKKALDMYNRFKNDFRTLCSPTINGGTNTELTQSTATKNLSLTIQKQCLLLQDTPRR